MMGVRPTTELARIVADGDDADLVSVLFAEHHDRAHLTGLRQRHDFPCHGQVFHAALVDDVRHSLDLLTIEWAWVVEVETQLFGTDVRALLARAGPEAVFERAM